MELLQPLNYVNFLQNASNLMVNEGIELVAAALTPPNSYYNTPKDIERFRQEKNAAKVRQEMRWRIQFHQTLTCK